MTEREGEGWSDSEYATSGSDGGHRPGLYLRRVHTCPFCGADVKADSGRTMLASHLPECEGYPP